MLARHWGFPDTLIDPIAFHHEPEVTGPNQDLVRCVTAGNILAQIVDEDLDPEADEDVRLILASIRFDNAFLAKLRVDLTCNLEETLSRATARPRHASDRHQAGHTRDRLETLCRPMILV